MRIVLFALFALSLQACGFIGFPGVYRIDVEQGNIVNQELADQLQPGMSRRQVRFILGTPLVEDSFNQDRWDYPYVKRNGQDVLDQSYMTVIFDGDSLAEVTGDYLPPAWQTADQILESATENTEEADSSDAEGEAQDEENAEEAGE